VYLALIPAVFVGVVLGMLGAGGSILTVPILIFIARVDARSATVTSLVVVGVTSAIAAVQHWRAGRSRPKVALLFALAGAPGAIAGAWLSRQLTPRATMLIFSAVMVVSALGMLFRRERETPHERSAPGIAAVGLMVGAITGVVGAGGGFLIVPGLVLFAGVPITHAVGTSLITITLNCAVSLAGKWGSAPVDWRFTLAFTAVCVAGSFAGLALSKRVQAATLRRAFAALVLAIAAVMALAK
jgi:uncharacterized protein